MTKLDAVSTDHFNWTMQPQIYSHMREELKFKFFKTYPNTNKTRKTTFILSHFIQL